VSRPFALWLPPGVDVKTIKGRHPDSAQRVPAAKKDGAFEIW